jgi:hypothetical protein
LKGILKWPLIIAALVVVLRVVVERAGGPSVVSSLLSIAALHTVLVPVYVAIRLGGSPVEHPYRTLFKLILIFAVATRAMLLPVYWLARIFIWPESRFAGLADSSPLIGFVAIPMYTALIWIVSSVVVGGAIGSLVLAIMNSRTKVASNS